LLDRILKYRIRHPDVFGYIPSAAASNVTRREKAETGNIRYSSDQPYHYKSVSTKSELQSRNERRRRSRTP
jgi:hypothetical protein